MLKKILCGVSRLLQYWYYSKNYDSKYLKNHWFAGKCLGAMSTGVSWVIHDAKIGKIMGTINSAPWPVDPRTTVIHSDNITFDPEDLNNFQNPGCYYQAIGKICIGSGTWIGPNVGIITANHLKEDLSKHDVPKDVKIGSGCWIGMNSIILPGVTLGDKTIVGAGSVVTKSFPEGNCVLVGNPAIVKKRNL